MATEEERAARNFPLSSIDNQEKNWTWICVGCRPEAAFNGS